MKQLEFDLPEIYFKSTIQSSIWAWITSINISTLEDGIILTYGFIRGDDFWHYRPEFEKAVSSLVKISSNVSVQFNYPLEWLYKKKSSVGILIARAFSVN